MAFSSVAVVAGITTLTSSLFKNTELRVKDVIELSKLSNEEINNHPQLKIVKNDINFHITGIEDPIFHEALIEIMAKHNKSVGYFKKLDGRIVYSAPYHISIIKPNWKERIKFQFKSMHSDLASLTYISTILLILTIAIEMDTSSETIAQAAAIILAGLAGIVFSYLLTGLSVQWRKNSYQVKDCEYKLLFEEYKNDKLKDSISSRTNISINE